MWWLWTRGETRKVQTQRWVPIRSRPDWILGLVLNLGPPPISGPHGPKKGVARWQRLNWEIYISNDHLGLVYDILYINFLAWIQRIISLACFANNVIHPWNQMILIFDREMPAGFTHVICYTSITILSISPLWSTGETHLVTKTSKILFWTVIMPSFEKSFQRPWLHGLKNMWNIFLN